jgi:tetratricopeptide (TPR) repeat protein
VLNELNINGVNVEIKKQNHNGNLEQATDNQIASLNTKAKIAGAAKALSTFNSNEKLEWALHMKNEGKKLFDAGSYNEAMSVYVETLTASDFRNSLNIEKVVIPILCNLSACSIELNDWSKSLKFCEQAIQLRPCCAKAHLRSGISFYYLQDYGEALKSFKVARSLATKQSSEQLNSLEYLHEKDLNKIETLIKKVKVGLKKDKEDYNKQKQRLTKAFTSSSNKTVVEIIDNKIVNNINYYLLLYSAVKIFFSFVGAIIKNTLEFIGILFK